MIGAEEFLALTKTRVSKVSLNGDGGEVYIRSISELERSRYEALAYDKKAGNLSVEGTLKMRATLLAYCMCDEKGARLFKTSDVPRLMAIDAAIAGLIFDACIVHCGMGEDAKKKDLTLDGNSHTSSPETEA